MVFHTYTPRGPESVAVSSSSPSFPLATTVGISVGEGTEKRKTLKTRFTLDPYDPQVVKVVLSNESEALRRTLLSVVVVAAVGAMLVDSLDSMFAGGSNPG